MNYREYVDTMAHEINLLDDEIMELPDEEIVAFIEGAESWDSENVLGAVCYLAKKYDVPMIDGNGEWKCSEDVMLEIKGEIEERKNIKRSKYRVIEDDYKATERFYGNASAEYIEDCQTNGIPQSDIDFMVAEYGNVIYELLEEI